MQEGRERYRDLDFDAPGDAQEPFQVDALRAVALQPQGRLQRGGGVRERGQRERSERVQREREVREREVRERGQREARESSHLQRGGGRLVVVRVLWTQGEMG